MISVGLLSTAYYFLPGVIRPDICRSDSLATLATRRRRLEKSVAKLTKGELQTQEQQFATLFVSRS